MWAQTSYTVWANNSGGSTVAYLNITVIDLLPALSYATTNLNLTNNTASSDLPLVPTLTGPGEITSWVINASLPTGLTFGTSNGTIHGTPTELWTQTAYTVWANNSGGSSAAYLNITVVDQLPSIAYTPSDLILRNNTVSSDLPLVSTLTVQGISLRGPSMQACPQAYPSGIPTVRFGAQRPNSGTARPTRSGRTTAVAQASPISTSRCSMNFHPSPIHLTYCI